MHWPQWPDGVILNGIFQENTNGPGAGGFPVCLLALGRMSSFCSPVADATSLWKTLGSFGGFFKNCKFGEHWTAQGYDGATALEGRGLWDWSFGGFGKGGFSFSMPLNGPYQLHNKAYGNALG